MAFKLFGMKCRLEVVVLTLMVGLFLGSTLLCNCMTYENFERMHPAPAHGQRDAAMEGKWMSQQQFPTNPHKAMLSTLQGNTGLKVPLADDQMLIFSQNKFDPSCCDGPGSNYSSSGGCNCITDEQAQYLNQRAGNRTFATTY